MTDSPLILVVEDDQPIRELYLMKFRSLGYRVESAVNGEDGLKKAETLMPSLILLDLRMPIMSGDEMLAHLRAEEWGASIRVIILTNLSKDEAPQSLRFLHVDRYVVKAHHTPTQVAAIAQEVLSGR